MHSFLLALLIAMCAGCLPGVDRQAATEANEDGDDNGNGDTGGLSAAECQINSDCAPAGPKCCDCPTHAVPKTDPARQACLDVDCAPKEPDTCGSPMRAACEVGKCVLECAPVACEMTMSCPSGFATDANGCLTCACAASDELGECSNDSQCARVRDDCCGCAEGGEDTAVPTSSVAAHNAMLMCPTNPSCPGTNTCAPDLAARCVQGTCALVAGALPANACGRSDLPVCPVGEACYVNASDQATMHGVGICQP